MYSATQPLSRSATQPLSHSFPYFISGRHFALSERVTHVKHVCRVWHVVMCVACREKERETQRQCVLAAQCMTPSLRDHDTHPVDHTPVNASVFRQELRRLCACHTAHTVTYSHTAYTPSFRLCPLCPLADHAERIHG